MYSDLDVFKQLILFKGSIDKERYRDILVDVLERLNIHYIEQKEDEEIRLLKEYFRRVYKVGGRRLDEYILVLKKQRGLVKEVKEMLGELKL